MDTNKINNIDDLFMQLEYEERQLQNRQRESKETQPSSSKKDRIDEEEDDDDDDYDDGAGVISRMPADYKLLNPNRNLKPIKALCSKNPDDEYIEFEESDRNDASDVANVIEESRLDLDRLSVSDNDEGIFGIILDKSTVHKGHNMRIFNLLYSKPWQLCSEENKKKFLKIQTVRRLVSFLRAQTLIPWQTRRPRVILYFIRELEHFGFFTCHVKTELMKSHNNIEFVEIVLLVRRLTGHFESAIVAVVGFHLIPIIEQTDRLDQPVTKATIATIEKNGKLIDKKPSTVDIMYRRAHFANFFMDIQKVSYDLQARSTGDKK